MRFLAAVFCLLLNVNNMLSATELKVAVSGFSGIQREAFLTLANDFQQLNPNIKVSFVLTEDTVFKDRLNDWLSQHNEFDLVVWHAGERLRDIAQKGYVHPISAIWEKEHYDNYFSLAMSQAVSLNNVPYGIPISTYQWGLYYNKSVFRQYQLTEPANWNEFIGLIEKLNARDIIPVTLASGSGWPVAGWYEYLNLRINVWARSKD